MATPPWRSGAPLSRRQLLRRTACGFGHVALLAMLNQCAAAIAGDGTSPNPLALRPSQYVGKAKRIIFLFMHGGVSHIDTFDPKSKLDEMDGKPLPYPLPRQFAETGNLMRSPWRFHRYGESGLPVSTLFPHVGSVIDDICLIRSMHVEQVDHGGAILQLHTGSAVFPRPSLGAWVSYGLGTENQNLPSFVAISPPMLHGAQQNFGAAFLPACFQGTPIGDAKTPMIKAKVSNLRRAELTDEVQRMQLDFIQQANYEHLAKSPPDSRLEARIESFELAFRMQAEAPEALDLATETASTMKLYGVDGGPADNFGRQCLMARRLIERGVRFVQCSHSYKWDQHAGLKQGHETNATEVDLPIAGLITDLKQRGLLDDTLVVWGTEFGRTPVSQGGDGRDHNPYGFTMWLAGGGVKGGMAYGETDELGYKAVKDRVSMYDFHATLLHLLGIDHTRLTYPYNGRNFRLTDVHGRIVHEIVA